jgi:hypothetical protein
MEKPILEKKINPPVSKGDRIMCVHMNGESGVTPGTTGTVTRTSKDPFSDGDHIISVDWDNGSPLALLSVCDYWKLVNKNTIKEQSGDEQFWNMIKNDREIFNYFDWRFLRKFLHKVRESGIVNMYGSANLLYAGRDWIERHYGDQVSENNYESFEEVLEDANEAKHKMIQGVLKYCNEKNKDIDDISSINYLAKKFSNKIFEIYTTMSIYSK